jgi:AcrR family transcriptional regulator
LGCDPVTIDAEQVWARHSDALADHIAGVGISALYRRYPSKEDLLRELARDGLTRYIEDLHAALARGAGRRGQSASGCAPPPDPEGGVAARGRHPADVLLILEMITFVDLPGPDRGRELRKKPPNSGRFFPNAGGQTAKKTVS